MSKLEKLSSLFTQFHIRHHKRIMFYGFRTSHHYRQAEHPIFTADIPWSSVFRHTLIKCVRTYPDQCVSTYPNKVCSDIPGSSVFRHTLIKCVRTYFDNACSDIPWSVAEYRVFSCGSAIWSARSCWCRRRSTLGSQWILSDFRRRSLTGKSSRSRSTHENNRQHRNCISLKQAHLQQNCWWLSLKHLPLPSLSRGLTTTMLAAIGVYFLTWTIAKASGKCSFLAATKINLRQHEIHTQL